MKTSARNTFQGEIVNIKPSGILAEVELKTAGGYGVVALVTKESVDNLGLAKGRSITALVKATQVFLTSGAEACATSARNNLLATVESVKTEGIVSEVKGRLDDGTGVCALITETSANKLGLVQGAKARFQFKVTSVLLATD